MGCQVTAERNDLQWLRNINQTAAFNRWLGLDVISARDGEVTIRAEWRDELGQYAGFAHAGVVAGLVDTACGYAAALAAGHVLASHCSVHFLAPAIGGYFTATGRVIKAGRRQILATADLHAHSGGSAKLVATGQTLLMPPEPQPT